MMQMDGQTDESLPVHHPVLFQNADRTVILIDIPSSIAHAQGFERRIVSAKPRDQPFPSTEPKSQKARDKILAKHKLSASEVEILSSITAAFDEIRQKHTGSWTLPRFTFEHRGFGNTPEEDEALIVRRIDDLLSRLFKPMTVSKEPTAMYQVQTQIPGLSEVDLIELWDGTWLNAFNEAACLSLSLSKDDQYGTTPIENQVIEHTGVSAFHVPAASSFILSNCRRAERLRNHVKWASQEHDRSRFFDFILLDPPWENASAKRRTAYATGDVEGLISGMDLGNYLRPGGLVGIWVTNKQSVREMVLGDGGIFDMLNVSLVEQWIWVKVTSAGEAITQLDGIWRKPYEVLLLGQAPDSRLQLAQPMEQVTKRVIFGVPDFHSRKPCLKTLIESMLPAEHQVLEVFARYLVEKWTSWGDEVLKYNYEGYLEKSDMS